MKRVLLPALAALLVSTAAMAQPMRIRGTIAAITPTSMTVTSRDGARLDVALGDKLIVSTVKPLKLADIKSGSYIGTATRSGPNNSLVAIEVLVFPEAMRGAGEGHYPWDLESGSMMTNATVSGTVSEKAGEQLSLTYKGGANKVVVPPGTPIVTFAPATAADLKVGARVFLGATKDAAGKLSASRVVVATNGVAPPM